MRKIYIALLVFNLFALNQLMAQCPSNNLLLDFPFDSSYQDMSLYQEDTFVYGTPEFITDRHGNPYSAISTANGSIGLTNAINGAFKAPFPFTVSVWVYPFQLGTKNIIFMNEDHSYAYSGAWINIGQTGQIHAQVGNGGNAGPGSRFTHSTGSVINNNEWAHIAVVYESISDIRVYLNGIEQSTTTSGTANSLAYVAINGTPGKIGSGVNGVPPAANFNGAIDDVRFWDVALSDIQIQALYNSQTEIASTDSVMLCDDQTVDISVPNQFCDYNWSNGATSAVNSLDGGDFTVGNHVIYVNTFDEYNIQYSDSVVVSVSICTGVDDEVINDKLSVYPNPVTDQSMVYFSNILNEPFSVVVYDVSGRQVWREDGLSGKTYQLSSAMLNSGIYTLELLTKSARANTKLIVR